MDINEVQQEAQKWAQYKKTCDRLSMQFAGKGNRMNELLQKADLHGAHELYQRTMKELTSMAEFIRDMDSIPSYSDMHEYERIKKQELGKRLDKNKSLEELKKTDWND